MGRLFLLILGLMCCLQGTAQEVNRYAAEITETGLYNDLVVLTSDSLEGRATGKIGQIRAANFIAKKFKAQGLTAPVQGSFFQKFELVDKKWGEVYLKINKQTLTFFKDF